MNKQNLICGSLLLVQSRLSFFEVRSKKKGGRRDTFYNRKRERGLENRLVFCFNLCVNCHSSMLPGAVGGYHFCQGLMIMVGEEK